MFGFSSSTESFDNFTRDDLSHNYLRIVFDTWEKHKAHDQLPKINDIDLTELKSVFGYLGLIRLEQNPFRAKYILSGQELNRLYGKKISGLYLDQAFGKKTQQEPEAAYKKSAQTQTPLYSRRMLRTPLRALGYDRLLLPCLNAQGSEVDTLIICIIPTDKDVVTAKDWQEQDDVAAWLSAIEYTPDKD